ncbi:MAG: peptidylprolyl isomerase [Planctomycetes bacterium]|nr:peptidylprolyl isomerase [Planctomycetota bacterium]
MSFFSVVFFSASVFFVQNVLGETSKSSKPPPQKSPPPAIQKTTPPAPPQKSDQPAIEDSNVVALVNNKKIARQELYDILVETYGEEALDVLIRRTLIYQAAEKEGAIVTGAEVEQRLKTLVGNEIDGLMASYKIKDKADLDKELAKMGGSLAMLEERLSRKMKKQAEIELLAEKVLAKTITVTDEDLQKVYELEYGEKIEASQIVYKTRREAEEALQKLRSGADFAALAKSESIDRVTAARGGKMQPFSPKDTLGAQVASLKVGELSDIVKSDYGHHIIKITGKKAASGKGYKTVKAELEKIARNQQYKERLGPWLLNLVESATITKNLNTK